MWPAVASCLWSLAPSLAPSRLVSAANVRSPDTSPTTSRRTTRRRTGTAARPPTPPGDPARGTSAAPRTRPTNPPREEPQSRYRGRQQDLDNAVRSPKAAGRGRSPQTPSSPRCTDTRKADPCRWPPTGRRAATRDLQAPGAGPHPGPATLASSSSRASQDHLPHRVHHHHRPAPPAPRLASSSTPPPRHHAEGLQEMQQFSPPARPRQVPDRSTCRPGVRQRTPTFPAMTPCPEPRSHAEWRALRALRILMRRTVCH